MLALVHFRHDEELIGDEGAMQRLLDVLQLCIRSQLRSCLGNADICTIVETCFSLCHLPKASELFKRQAELVCIDICLCILKNVANVHDDDDDDDDDETHEMGDTNLKICFPGTRAGEPEPLPPALAALEAELDREVAKAEQLQQKQLRLTSPTMHPSTPQSSATTITPKNLSSPVFEAEIPSPYGLSAVLEILNYLLRLLDVGEKRSTDRLKSLCLLILGDFIELHSERVKIVKPLWILVSTKVTKTLIQLLLSLENPSIASYLHQCIFAVFGRYRRQLMAQFELLLSSLLSLLIQKFPPGKTVRIGKEYYMELLLYFCLQSEFLCDLYVFYECGMRFGFILSDFIKALALVAMTDTRQANQQDSAPWIALETIISILRLFAALPLLNSTENDAKLVRLADARRAKTLLVQSAELFNTNPKKAFAFLVEHQITSKEVSPPEIAKYLRRTAGLDKKHVGELISKPSNIEILREYLADFHFAGSEIDEALRLVLESFRLPGEAQQISRIMEIFAQIYYRDASQRGIYKNEDSVYVLAYSIVMLNTDQHNKQVKHRMTLDQFIRNNRGINDGENFEEAFLARIYYAIKDKEIVMPEEQGAETAFNYTWNEQLKKYIGISEEEEVFSLDELAKDILTLAWTPFLSCFRALILSPRTDAVTKMAIKGLSELGQIADRFLETPQIDELVQILAESLAFKEVVNNQAGNQLSRYLARSEFFQSLFRCFCDQFRLYGGKIRDGWTIFIFHLLLLVESKIVSLATFEVDFGDRKSPTSPIKSGTDSGLFYALSQYLTSANATELSGVDSEMRTKAIEFTNTCRMDEIIRDSRFLELYSLNALLQAMVAQLCNVEGKRSGDSDVWGMDTLVFLVDLIVHTAWNNRDRMCTFWPLIFTRFSEIAKDLGTHNVLRQHCILGIGRLSLRFAERPDMQKEVVQFFQLLCFVPPDAFQTLAEPALSIVLRIAELDPPILRGTAIWPHYFTVLALAGRSKSCGPYSYGLLTTIVREYELLFPLDFYSEYVDLLNGFIASASSSTSLPLSPSISGEEGLSPIELASQALTKFAVLEANIRRLCASEELKGPNVWQDFMIPIHCAVAQQCYHPVRELRNQALSQLQKTLLSIDFSKHSNETLLDEFKLVMIPLLEELQRPELGEWNVDEIQTRAAAVLSKVFLANLSLLFPENDHEACERGENLWLELLRNFLRFLKGKEPSESLRDSIPETIKNMMLVMTTTGVLKADSMLWERTWVLLEPIMPRAKMDDICKVASPKRLELEDKSSINEQVEIDIAEEETPRNTSSDDENQPEIPKTIETGQPLRQSSESEIGKGSGPQRPSEHGAMEV